MYIRKHHRYDIRSNALHVSTNAEHILGARRFTEISIVEPVLDLQLCACQDIHSAKTKSLITLPSAKLPAN